jgi:tight adherence protein C
MEILISLLPMSAIALLTWALFRNPAKPEPPMDRRIALALGLPSRQTVFELPAIGRVMGLLMGPAGRFPLGRVRIRRDLDASGNPNGYSVDEYLAICLAGAIALTGVVVLMLGAIGQFDWLMVMAAPPLGFVIPLVVLREAAQARMKAIARKLPYTMDLIALLMEAGATFAQAVRTLVTDEPDDELNRELKIVEAQIGFGTTRAAALEGLARRIPLESLRSMVGAINQAEALGTGLSVILKNQSGMIRMLRSVRAEEASASAATRILLPSMLILIAVVMMVFAPLVIKWIEGRLFVG